MENCWREITSCLISAHPPLPPTPPLLRCSVEVEEKLGQESRASQELGRQMKVLLLHLAVDVQLWVRG